VTGTAVETPAAVLVLAGQRAGAADPLLAVTGHAAKALVPVAGRTMLSRVVEALHAGAGGAACYTSGLAPEHLAQAGLPEDVAVTPLAGSSGPAASVIAAIEAGGLPTPLLVTTCDHPLLRPEIVAHFLAEARASGADIAVGLAERSVIETAFPGARRTYLRLGGTGYSGCNLFYIARPAGLAAVRFWQEAERDRKRPWRIARRFGVGSLLWLLLARPGPDAAFAHLSRRLGVRAAPVILPFAEAAMDVDKPADLAEAEALLGARQAAPAAAPDGGA